MALYDKTATKLRIVFDASAKIDVSSSLIGSLHTGPSLRSSLFGALLRFRVRNIAIVGDLGKAFLQISLRSEDRNVIKYL